MPLFFTIETQDSMMYLSLNYDGKGEVYLYQMYDIVVHSAQGNKHGQ
jgi:hypothetical protein